MSGPGHLAVTFAVAAALASCGGQSQSRSGSNGDDATAGTSGTSSNGGSSTTGGSGGAVSTGGAVSKGGGATGGGASGASGSSTGASAGAAGRPVSTDPECADVRRDMPCEPEGKECRALVCGLGDAGRRDCFCASVWTCTTCDGVRPVPPDVDVPLCPNDVVEGGPCVTESSLCGPLDNGEYCACYASEAGLVWDCELPPGPWPE